VVVAEDADAIGEVPFKQRDGALEGFTLMLVRLEGYMTTIGAPLLSSGIVRLQQKLHPRRLIS
jgi:hypothetical protein